MSKVAVLSLLDAYGQVHEKGQKDQKNCTWHLTVARQNKGRHGALTNGVLMADDVREELRAIQVLKSSAACGGEPSLTDEQGSEKKKKSKDILERQFVLADATTASKEENAATRDDDGDDKDSTGLRRRKGGDKSNKNDDDGKQWSVEEAKDQEKVQEERLRTANPLDLFGAMPPQELRKAQKDAQEALAAYVEAANLVAAIQEHIRQASK